MTHPLTHPEQAEQMARGMNYAQVEGEVRAGPTTTTVAIGDGELDQYRYDAFVDDAKREAGRSAKPDVSPVAGDLAQIEVPALSRYENNMSDARMLAEDAAELARRFTQAVNDAEWVLIAQAKALASIALSMAFKEGAS